MLHTRGTKLLYSEFPERPDATWIPIQGFYGNSARLPGGATVYLPTISEDHVVAVLPLVGQDIMEFIYRRQYRDTAR